MPSKRVQSRGRALSVRIIRCAYLTEKQPYHGFESSTVGLATSTVPTSQCDWRRLAPQWRRYSKNWTEVLVSTKKMPNQQVWLTNPRVLAGAFWTVPMQGLYTVVPQKLIAQALSFSQRLNMELTIDCIVKMLHRHYNAKSIKKWKLAVPLIHHGFSS